MDFLRVVLGLFCLFFAHFLGRSIVRVGAWDEQRPKKQEDLTREIFGE
jgi:hypothetical protein